LQFNGYCSIREDSVIEVYTRSLEEWCSERVVQLELREGWCGGGCDGWRGGWKVWSLVEIPPKTSLTPISYNALHLTNTEPKKHIIRQPTWNIRLIIIMTSTTIGISQPLIHQCKPIHIHQTTRRNSKVVACQSTIVKVWPEECTAVDNDIGEFIFAGVSTASVRLSQLAVVLDYRVRWR